MTKCAICRIEYQKWSMTQKVCMSPECAVEWARRERIKRERKAGRELASQTKARRDALKTLAQLANEVQVVVNKLVRLRDRDFGCISCDRDANWGGQWHASHFKSVGANSALRFHLWNIHKACSICNHHLSGNIANYEPRLRNKIGAKVDFLNSHPSSRRYSRDELIRLKDVFKKMLRRLERRMA